jgi:hypothetical protein
MSNCGPCGNYLCTRYGCQRTAPCNPPGIYQLPVQPRGCVCPPGSEQTCKGTACPRQPIKAAEWSA